VGPPAHGGAPAGVSEEVLDVKKGDALLMEIESFLESIATGKPPAVSGEEGLKAMIVAERIIRDISDNRIP
jgi:predicted dehydrogenase